MKELSKEEKEKYNKQLCEECKKNIQEFTRKLSARDFLRPKKTAKKYAKILCYPCRLRMKKAVQQ